MELINIIKMLVLFYIAYIGMNSDLSKYILVAYSLLIIILTFGKALTKNSKLLILIEATITILFSFKYISVAILIVNIEIIEFFLEWKINKHLEYTVSLFIPIIIGMQNHISIEEIFIMIIITTNFKFYIQNNNKLNLYEAESLNKSKEIINLNSKMTEERRFHGQDIYSARLEERAKVSGKLHDKIGHTISSVLLQLEAIKVMMKTDEKRANEMITASIEILRSGMDEIRMTLRNIRPASEELGINRLRLMMEEKTKNTAFKFEIKTYGDLEKIPAALWHIFLESTMELSTNCIKYSKGNLINIEITVLNKVIKFEVRDNGIGCENLQKHIGLNNIEDKVSREKGKIIIDTEGLFSVILLFSY